MPSVRPSVCLFVPGGIVPMFGGTRRGQDYTLYVYIFYKKSCILLKYELCRAVDSSKGAGSQLRGAGSVIRDNNK